MRVYHETIDVVNCTWKVLSDYAGLVDISSDEYHHGILVGIKLLAEAIADCPQYVDYNYALVPYDPNEDDWE